MEISNETSKEVSEPVYDDMNDDLLTPLVSAAVSPINFNPEHATLTHTVHIPQLADENTPVLPPSVHLPLNTLAPPGSDLTEDQKALKVLGKEHMDALERNKKLEKLLSEANLKILQLESEVSRGIYMQFEPKSVL